MKIILASASPRRQELIKMITDDVEVFPAVCDETVKDGLVGKDVAEYLSIIKGEAVKENFKNEIIVSADTIVCLGNEILGKPKSREDAFSMLKKLSGNTHSVFTGVTIIKGEKKKTFSNETKVTFYDASDDEINEYLDCLEYKDKAGSYGIQGKGGLLVEKIHGDYFNVVGLPVARLKRELSDFLN